MIQPVAIDVRLVSKVYGRAEGSVAYALKDAACQVREGEFVSVVGPTGCGKTTLLRIVGDLLSPTSGEVEVYGQSARQAREARHIGIVFQSPVLYDWRNIRRNVELPLEIIGLSREQRSRMASEVLGRVGLEQDTEHFPWQLSGGMQQRVAIARALVFDPRILLMDEPFGALDEFTREAMQQELLRIWSEARKSVLFITHSIPEAVFLSDRVIVMSRGPGRIVGELTVDLERPRTEETRTSKDYYEAVTRVRQLLAEAHGLAPVASGERIGDGSIA